MNARGWGMEGGGRVIACGGGDVCGGRSGGFFRSAGKAWKFLPSMGGLGAWPAGSERWSFRIHCRAPPAFVHHATATPFPGKARGTTATPTRTPPSAPRGHREGMDAPEGTSWLNSPKNPEPTPCRGPPPAPLPWAPPTPLPRRRRSFAHKPTTLRPPRTPRTPSHPARPPRAKHGEARKGAA